MAKQSIRIRRCGTLDRARQIERTSWLDGVHAALRELAAELRSSDLQESSRLVELAAESVQRAAQVSLRER